MQTRGKRAADQGTASFLSDIKTLRSRARSVIEQGAVTHGCDADISTVLQLLNAVLATELVCVLRYRRHYFVAEGILADAVKKELLAHADEVQEHADQVASRIVQLGDKPNFDPSGLTMRSHSRHVEGKSLEGMIKEDLIAERIAIETYREMIRYLQDRDATTRRMLEQILAREEEHAEEMASALQGSHSVMEARCP